MTWDFWCCFSIVLNLFIIFTQVKSYRPSLIIENLIPEKINPDLLRIDIKKTDETVLYHLEFKKTKGILANSETPVIKYLDDIENRDKLIKFYPDYEVMQRIGNFSFYHDIDNKASAVLFSDSNGHYLDGIIKDEFRLSRFPVNYLDKVLKRPQRHIIHESSSNIERLDDDTLSSLNNAAENNDAFYPELLVVLDYNLLADISKVQAIKKQLVYWNAVDMLFASMKSPKIHLNIAAFILPSSQYAFPFLENDPDAKFVDFYDAIEGIETFFYKYQDQVPVEYDIIVAMTGAKLCVRPTRAHPVMNCINGFSEGKPDIVNKFDHEREAVDSSAILHFDNRVSSFTNAAQKIAYMFTGEYTRKKERKACPGIMEEYYHRGRFSLSWSTCTQRKVTNYLQSPKAEALKNFPKYLLKKKEAELLPTESPKSSEGWWGRLKNWILTKNKVKNNKTTNIIITTETSLPEPTEKGFEITEKVSEITERMPEINDPNVNSQQLFVPSEASSYEQFNLITTTGEPSLPEITEKEFEITEKVSEITERVPEINYPNVDSQQTFTSSEASSSGQINLITTTESSLPAITKQVLKVNDPNVNLQQDFTDSEALLDNLHTNPNPNVYSTIKPSSKNYLESLEDNINTTPNLSGYSPTEPSSENYPVDDISSISNPSDYSTPKPSSEGILDENKKDESLSFESRVEEEKPSTLEPVKSYDENLSSTTAASLIENHQESQDDSIFVAVTVPSEESDSVVNDHTNVAENKLVESIVSSELNQQNVSDASVVNSVVEEQVDEAIERYEVTSESSHHSHEDDPYNFEQSDQAVPPNEQEDTEASDESPPTLESDKLLSDPNVLAQENNILLTKRQKRLSSERFEEGASSESTNTPSTSPTEPPCKKGKMNLDVTLQLNINTNDKNIQTLKKSFHSNSLNQENENTTNTNDNNKIIKSIVDYLLKHSNR